MALLKYLREKAVLPNPNGLFRLDCMPSAAISSANKEVKDLVNATPSDSRKRVVYQNYTDIVFQLPGIKSFRFFLEKSNTKPILFKGHSQP